MIIYVIFIHDWYSYHLVDVSLVACVILDDATLPVIAVISCDTAADLGVEASLHMPYSTQYL